MAGGKVLGGLLGLMAAGGLTPDEAEAAAVPGFAKMYAQAVANGSKKMLHAGTLEPNVFEQAMRRDPAITQNVVKVGTHGGNARLATGEMEPLEVGQHIENMLNSVDTRVLPNFPSHNYRNNAGGMFYLNDGKNIVSPFSGGSGGDVVLRTVFEPTKDNRKFIEGYLGRPVMFPISGIRNDVPASAQPLGLSAVRQPSVDTTLSGGNAQSKSKLPSIAGAVTGASLGSMPLEAPLESPWFDPVDVLVAPVGVPGAAAKAGAAALAPAWNYAADNALGGLLGLFQRDGGKQ